MPRIIFGGGGIGTTGEGGFTHTWDTPEKTRSLLKTLKELDIYEIDSAASYPPGNRWHTETLLGQARAADEFRINSKIGAEGRAKMKLNDEAIAYSVDKSLTLLGMTRFPILFAHAPDRKTPVEETAAAFHRQFEAGRFEKLGLCNYSVEQLEEYFAVCEKHGYVKPSVIQDMYNAVFRSHEEKLLPLLRKHGCSFQAFSPLAGGFLSGRLTKVRDAGDEAALHKSRFAADSLMKLYTDVFDKPALHEAMHRLAKVCEETGTTPAEASLRWLIHHSTLGENDAVIVGARSVDHVVNGVAACRKAPLDEKTLAAVEQMWTGVDGTV